MRADPEEKEVRVSHSISTLVIRVTSSIYRTSNTHRWRNKANVIKSSLIYLIMIAIHFVNTSRRALIKMKC